MPNIVAAMSESSWQERAAAKVADIVSQIPERWRIAQEGLDLAANERQLSGPFIQSFLSQSENKIVNTASPELCKQMASGSISSLEVTEAFCKSAAIAQQIGNCMHEIFFDKALARAAQLDRYLEENEKPMGPLHGLPVSLKDIFHVAGVETTMGYIGWIGTFEGSSDQTKLYKTQSQVVDELLMQGAVLYCKTSVPQTLMWSETINNIIGHTPNPVVQGLSCGGSSGGEAALQAMRASSVGLGSDVAGSVRIPAAFCGTYSIKPTSNRLSFKNAANTNPGQLNAPASIGVMGTSIGSLKLVMSAVLATKPWLRDPNVVPLPWRSDMEQEVLERVDGHGRATAGAPLRIGILHNDGHMRPHPPIARGLRMIEDVLTSAGHEVVDWNPPSHSDAAQIHMGFLQSDGGHDIHKQLELSGEPIIPPLRQLFEPAPPFSAVKIQELAVAARDSCDAYLQYYRTATADGREVDAFIMPVAPHAAVIPGRQLYIGYTEIVNLLDYSAAVIPVTNADKKVDLADPNHVPLNDLDELNWSWYDPEAYHGAPVGLQIVCRKYEEEKVWAIAQIVDTLLRGGKED
jgi:amidase